MRKQIISSMSRFAVIIVCVLLGLVAASFTTGRPRQVDLTMYARQYAFDPPTVRVNKGDTVSINLITRDVTHGFYLEGYDIDAKVAPEDAPEYSTLFLRHPSKGDDFQEVERINFVANKTGKFRFRCSVTCGYLHPFMQGELIVNPNYPFWAGIGLLAGIAITTLSSLVAGTMQKLSPCSSGEKTINSGNSTQND